jgi:hypothetical protein
MADLSSRPDFDLDTAVSADLDGELDGYAAELGVPVGELRAAVATAEASARRSELTAVRATLAHDAEPGLDDVTRRRLLDGAGVGTRASRAQRNRGWILRAGAAAAVTLVVVAALYALVGRTDGSGDPGTKASGGGSSATAAVTGDVGDVGTIDAAEVARLLRGARRSAAGSSTAPEQAPPEQSTSARRTTNDFASGTDRNAVALVTPQAVDACATQYGTEGTVRFRGSGRYAGRPAVVLGIDTETRTIVFVVAADDCTQVLYSASR